MDRIQTRNADYILFGEHSFVHAGLMDQAHRYAYMCNNDGYWESEPKCFRKGNTKASHPIFVEWLAVFFPPEKQGLNDILHYTGLSLQLNGSCHTLCARLLAISPICFSCSILDVHNVIGYGIYGLDRQRYIVKLRESADKAGIPKDIKDAVIGRVENCLPDELSVWFAVLNDLLKFEETLHMPFAKWIKERGLETKALEILQAWDTERTEIFQKNFNEADDHKPFPDQQVDIRNGLVGAMRKRLQDIMDFLQTNGHMTEEWKRGNVEILEKFVDKMSKMLLMK